MTSREKHLGSQEGFEASSWREFLLLEVSRRSSPQEAAGCPCNTPFQGKQSLKFKLLLVFQSSCSLTKEGPTSQHAHAGSIKHLHFRGLSCLVSLPHLALLLQSRFLYLQSVSASTDGPPSFLSVSMENICLCLPLHLLISPKLEGELYK